MVAMLWPGLFRVFLVACFMAGNAYGVRGVRSLHYIYNGSQFPYGTFYPEPLGHTYCPGPNRTGAALCRPIDTLGRPL